MPENKELKINGYRVTVEWVNDDYPDLSFYGRYSNKPEGKYTVDRYYGYLLGEYVETEINCPTCDNRVLYIGGIECPCPVCDDYGAVDLVELDLIDAPHGSAGREVLADVSSNWNRRQYRYFIPEYAQSEDNQERAIKTAVHDYERMEDYGNDWCMMGCVVKVYDRDKPHAEIGWESLWGIESDCDDEHIEEIEQELIAEAMPRVVVPTGTFNYFNRHFPILV